MPPAKRFHIGLENEYLGRSTCAMYLLSLTLNQQAELIATRVQIYIRDCNLNYRQFQCKLPYPTQSWREMVNCAMDLFRLRYTWQYPIRAVTIRAVDLISASMPQQLDLFGEHEKRKRNRFKE